MDDHVFLGIWQDIFFSYRMLSSVLVFYFYCREAFGQNERRGTAFVLEGSIAMSDQEFSEVRFIFSTCPEIAVVIVFFQLKATSLSSPSNLSLRPLMKSVSEILTQKYEYKTN